MSLYKYSKNDLIRLGGEGYKIVPCESEQEALGVKETLKANKRCAQAGYTINKEDKTIYFVLTKQRAAKAKEGLLNEKQVDKEPPGEPGNV